MERGGGRKKVEHPSAFCSSWPPPTGKEKKKKKKKEGEGPPRRKGGTEKRKDSITIHAFTKPDSQVERGRKGGIIKEKIPDGGEGEGKKLADKAFLLQKPFDALCWGWGKRRKLGKKKRRGEGVKS